MPTLAHSDAKIIAIVQGLDRQAQCITIDRWRLTYGVKLRQFPTARSLIVRSCRSCGRGGNLAVVMSIQDEPLTKGDIVQLMDAVQRVDQRMNRLEHKVEEFKGETTRHFDVVVEDLRHDLIGARSDEVELLKDGRRYHEKHIRRLEKSAGLIAV